MAEDKEKTLISIVTGEFSDLVNNFIKLVTKSNKIESIWLERLQLGKEVIEWSLKKYNIYFKGTPGIVKKGFIFYCELGFNIGSEQGDKRPVVVLQNNNGNSSSTTTIIAPITTHRGMEVIGEENGKPQIKFIDNTGVERIKKLDYYEIPVNIEPGYKDKITGYINLAQIRTISKKRFEKSHIAVITSDTEKKIKPALVRLLAM